MRKASLLALSLCLLGTLARGQTTASTNPVGFVSITVPAQSDFAMGTPLQQPAAFQGQIQSISGNQIVVAGTPGWAASQFVFAAGSQNVTYYVQIDSGTSEGLYAQISANDSNSITVTLNSGDSLSGVLSNATNAGGGDLISIIPYWTPSTLFSGMPTGTQLLLYSTTQAGINNAAATVNSFNGTDWKHGLTNIDNLALPPLQGMTLRNNSASPITLAITGAVPMTTNRILFNTLASNTQQDIWFFFNSPVPEVIGNLHLGITTGDQLLVYFNSGGINPAPSEVLSWNGTAWKHGLTDVTNTFTLTPGYGYVLRKAATATPTTFVWSALQSYLSSNPTP